MLLAASITAACAFTALADGWTMENGRWTYIQNGSKVTNEWRISGDGGYYYLGSDGYMVTNAFIDYERYADADGKMVTDGWRQCISPPG